MKVLVTGAAGFIGSHVAARLLVNGHAVTGLDNLNSYYDPQLKHARLDQLQSVSRFEFLCLDIANRSAMESLFAREEFDLVIHLAAQAGVRYSVENPHAYTESNITGFLNILEGCRRSRIGHLIYASSSSVYGGNTKTPFAVEDRVDHPVSLYAATKKANELMAHSYTHLFGIPTTGLRFFTVYGPWGRPDMAPFKFAKAILSGDPIEIYNYGRMKRDFTYIDDIVEGVIRVAAKPAAGYRLFNIGSSAPVELMDFVSELESALGKQARKKFLPMQAGDVVATYADVEQLESFTGYRPSTPLRAGVASFARWYLEYFQHPKPAEAARALVSVG
jgi:UDP-glucuronate 4-epimerase